MWVLTPQRITVVAADQTELVEVDVSSGDRRPSCLSIAVQQTIESIPHLERPPRTTSDDSKVIGWIANSAVFPTDPALLDKAPSWRSPSPSFGIASHCPL